MPLKLEDLGFKVGDLVTYNSDKESTGGIVFIIETNFDSPVPDDERHRWSSKKHSHPNGKPLKPMEVQGYLRLKPLFDFFPTTLGANPKGAGSTVLVYHTDIKRYTQYMKKVDLVTLGTKYMELGNVIRDLAIKHGMVSQGSQPAGETHDRPQE